MSMLHTGEDAAVAHMGTLDTAARPRISHPTGSASAVAPRRHDRASGTPPSAATDDPPVARRIPGGRTRPTVEAAAGIDARGMPGLSAAPFLRPGISGLAFMYLDTYIESKSPSCSHARWPPHRVVHPCERTPR